MTASRESQLLNIFENRLPEFYNTKDIRTNQVQMAVDIATFLHPSQKQKKILIVEAPVGTGKSLGALVPSLLECSMDRVFNPLRVVYATATINLQGQLMNSEVPLLEELGLVQNAILAKGKSHYYCHKETISNRRLKDSHLVSKLSKFYRDGLTGHRDEYENENGEVPNVLWDKVSLKASKRECERCNYYLACPSIQHRNRFLLPSNDLLITNHEQLIRSAINRLQEPPFPPIVPINPGIIVIDEAHHFLENFLSQTERSISIRSLTEIQKTSRFPHRLKDSFGRIINNISKILSDESESCESLQGRYPLATEIKDNLGKLSNILETAIDRVYFQSENRVAGHLDKEDDFLDRLEETLASVRNLLNEKQYVSWMTLDNLELSSIPVNFPTKFKEMIELLSKNNKIIVMSGTLTTNGDFTAFLNQWRLPKDSVETTSLTHSFQYEKQALIYVPSQLADPRKQDEFWFEDQLNHYEKLLTLTHGRTLLLSTSKAHMEQISERINEICMTLGVSFLKQEQGSVEQLTKQFKNDETSVLLGSGSFFSGFSIPGTSLVSVVFTRLPFPVPDDPYLKLIGAGFEDVFMAEVTIPYMMTKLNQGVGRLIRDIGDYGVITVLDPRVFDASYGELIRSDFEKKGYRFTRSLVEVENFISDKKTIWFTGILHSLLTLPNQYFRSS
ncbi:ATP-dependent DNA helicase [Cohnella rhizosphaerae]|uniref:ATP-dependent DNA helicase n=1 Tax=Cohnella rhizosphaerae TaxID=1457232 RepID=A0A9X4KRP7_9BACL|nr:ATP-dependent DNA helicase [Cohnella rhizosphaerae]MDG0809448.1 ATP-dependent DNA helicase [Cohnella rhizosphaerae]